MEIKKVIRTENTIFKNSQCLVVEYSDVLKTPFFLLLNAIQKSSVMGKIFDLSEIQNMNIAELYLWYIRRKNFNPYKDFRVIAEVENYDDNFANFMLETNLKSSDIFYSNDTELVFSGILKDLLRENDSNFLHKVIIYEEYGNDYVKHDIEKNYHSDRIDVEYRTGNFKSILSQIPRDSSYVISDIYRIRDLDEMDKLSYSSILIPYDFYYNIDFETKQYKLDIDALSKEKTFKLSFFKNSVI